MSTADKYPNWFAQAAQYNFDALLQEFVGKNDLCFLQLGAYTGDASVWIIENIFTGSNCILMDVDTWKGSKELAHEEMDFDDVFATYRNKVKPYNKILWKQIDTFTFLTSYNYIKEYDFIYIDADHTTAGVLIDAELSWPLLKSGGILAFDDYEWGSNLPMHLRAKPGIDLFLLRHEGQYELLVKNQQVWIRKL
jgi:hypothetical protein